MSETNAKLEKLLEELNTNIEILTKVTALSFRKDTIFKGKETKQEQIEALEELKLPDRVIALIIGSTAESIQTLRSLKKSKARKVTKTEPEKEEVVSKQ